MEKIKALFDTFGVYYRVISDKEIVIECPVDTSKQTLIPQEKIIKDNTTTCITDNGYVHILEDDFGELSWLVVIKNKR